MRKMIILLCIALTLYTSDTHAQASPDYTGGIKVKLNEDGTKYLRVLSWVQFWARYNGDLPNNSTQEQLKFSIRRARLLMISQISKDFMVLAHLGVNNLEGNNLSALGKGNSSQNFFHDFWAEYKIIPELSIGTGLHYWNGISRLNNQSTINMLTLDNYRQAWATLGLSDQFARHIGIFAKGSIGKFNYRASVNEAVTYNLQATNELTPGGPAIYSGRRILGSRPAGKNFSGYFEYNFLDQESQYLPYKVGTYLGSKRVFNLGAGFFSQPNAVVYQTTDNDTISQNATIFSVDAFYDAPIGADGGAITAYAMYQNQDYGRDYTLGKTYETGSSFYGHVGYVIPRVGKVKYQPYVSFANRSIEAIDDNATEFGIGGNIYLNGNNSKISLEYHNTKYGTDDGSNIFTVQTMIYL